MTYQWSETWTLGFHSTGAKAITGPALYGEQTVEVVSKLEAEQAVEKAYTRCESLEVALEEAVAEFESHAISELPHIAFGYGKARDWLKRRLLRVERAGRGSWISPEARATPDGPASPPETYQDKEAVREVITAARLWLRTEHGYKKPDLYETDAPAARLFQQTESLVAGEPVRNWDEILASGRKDVEALKALYRKEHGNES